MIADLEALAVHLRALQHDRKTDIRYEFTPELSARMNDASIVEALVAGLPMVQGIQYRIVRSRGRGAVLMAKLRYREGVRMLDHFHGINVLLTQDETAALETARSIICETVRLEDAAARFRYVYNWICKSITYVHTAPGKKGYERLVGAAGVLMDRQANCQGFADVLHLLCGLCGIESEYRCGHGARRLHVWNAVCLNGEWTEVDGSKGARSIAD